MNYLSYITGKLKVPEGQDKSTLLKSMASNALNFALMIPFLMVLSTLFAVGKDMANGVVSGKYPLFFLSMALISVSTIASFALNWRKVFFSAMDLLVTLFCVSGLVITYIHDGGMSHKPVMLMLVMALYFYFKLFLPQYKWNAYLLVLFFISTGFVEAVWGLRQLYGFAPSQHHLFKTTGSFFNSGPYAGYLAMVLPLAFYYMLDDYRVFKHKIRPNFIPFHIRWAISLLSFSAILLVLPATMGRASWLAAIAGCSVAGLSILFKNKRPLDWLRHNRKWATVYLTAIMLLAITGLTAIYHFKKDSADGRALIWKTSLQAIRENPFGAGLANFPGVYGEKQAGYFASKQGTEREQLIAGNPEYAFNEYLQVCVEFGAIPFFVFVSIIIYAVGTGIKRKNYAPIAALVSVLVFAGMSYPFSILPFLVSFVFLLALCTHKSEKIKGGDFSPACSLSSVGISSALHLRESSSLFFRETSLSQPFGKYGSCPSSHKTSHPVFLRKTGILLLLLFLISNAALYDRYPLLEAYRRWSKTKILYHANMYKNSVEEYAALYPLLDHEIQFLFEYAQSLSKSEDYQGSNRILGKAVKTSCDPMLYNVMGKNHQALGNYEMAEHSFYKAAMIVPSRLYPYYLLAKLYDEMGEGDKVCEMAEFILEKEAKVESEAVNEIKDEVKTICQKYNTL